MSTYVVVFTMIALVVMYVVSLAAMAYIGVRLHQIVKGFNKLVDHTAKQWESLEANSPKAWHVTYVAFIDHDSRNVGVPVQERLLFGKQFVFGSQTLEVKSDDQHVLSPSMFKDMLYKSLDNENIQQIEFVSVVPLRERDVAADAIYIENRSKFTFNSTTAAQGS